MPDLYAPDGTRLALHDLGGRGVPVLLVPGLCGHAVRIPGGGHDVHLDSPDHWRGELTEFLARPSPGRPARRAPRPV